MHVAICIVAFRNPGEIVDCLTALGQQSHDDFEVVLCENGGPEAHAALSAMVPDRLPGGQPVTVLMAPGNVGFAGGVNIGMRARPDADAWWIVNPDTVAESGALAALVARLGRGDCEAVGGTLYHPDRHVQGHGGRWRRWLARPESIGHGTVLGTPVDAAAVERQIDYLLGACMLVGQRFVEVAGLMREDYFLYAEEVEWCLRAKALGMRFGFAPDALIQHGQGGTTGSADSITERPRLPIYMDERNKLHVVRDTAPRCLPVAIPAALALLALRYGKARAWKQLGHAFAGWRASLRGERGYPYWMR